MTQKQPLLITGGSGYLGSHLATQASENYDVNVTYSSNPSATIGTAHPLDITNQGQVQKLIEQVKPQAIIHCIAANPGVDENKMMAINAEGTRFVAESAVRLGIRLVHVSTDALHDGKHPPYSDDAPPTPTNTYGQSKAKAEEYIKDIAPQAAIVRTSLIYGLREMDRGTAGFVKRLDSGEPLILFKDVYRQPVWAKTLATALLKLAFDRQDFSGILNVAGRQLISREDFGRLMLAWWGIKFDSEVKSGLGADLPHPPPLNIGLLVDKGEALLNMTFPGVEDVLAQAKMRQR
ncbi:MAG: SDR family oxidoreductase [Chloroflexota bacterium]